MATTALRDATAGLVVYASEDLATVWAQLQAAQSIAEAQAALYDVLPGFIENFAAAAANLAADWYDTYRTEQAVSGAFDAAPAAIGDLGAEALVGWGTQPLTPSDTQAEPNWDAALARITGGVQRRVTNAARETVMDNSIQDPAAVGWQRIGVGACAFCQMLIARGAVYSESTAGFASHDNCHCAAVPAFGGQPRPVQPYTPSVKRISDADRTRVREYLRTH